MVVTFDTMSLIWGVRRTATEGQEDMIPRAAALIERLRSDSVKAVVTSHVAAEYLGAFDKESRVVQRQELYRSFPVIPFDARAADIAAGLLYDCEPIKTLQDEFSVTRQVVKADVAIVATAIAAGVKAIYSTDRLVKRLGGLGKIFVYPIPEIHTQRDMFQ